MHGIHTGSLTFNPSSSTGGLPHRNHRDLVYSQTRERIATPTTALPPVMPSREPLARDAVQGVVKDVKRWLQEAWSCVRFDKLQSKASAWVHGTRNALGRQRLKVLVPLHPK